MKSVFAIVLLVAACDVAAAQSVPLPRPKPPEIAAAPPSDQAAQPEAPPEPSACRLRLTAELAIAPSLPPIDGPGDCGASDVVRLEAVVLADQSRVAVIPPATLRCTMAEAVADFVREDAARLVADLGSPLRSIQNFDSFDCRGRNRIVGAKTSEHGKANALDIRSFKLANGKAYEPTDPHLSRAFRENVRSAVCARFTTVLGPGSDGYHESHVHLDLAERRNGYRLCQWDVRDPEVPPPAPELASATSVPLPPPRPKLDEKGALARP